MDGAASKDRSGSRFPAGSQSQALIDARMRSSSQGGSPTNRSIFFVESRRPARSESSGFPLRACEGKMKSCWILFLSLSCLGAGGCCGVRQQQISALERENSQLNGLLWEMEFEVQSLEDENSELKQRLTSADDRQEEPAPRRPRSPEKSTKPSEAVPFDPDSFRPPVIEFPSEPSPEGTVPDSLLPAPSAAPLSPMPGQSTSRRAAAAVAPASHQEPVLSEPKIEIVPSDEISLDSSRIQRIALGPMIGTLHLDDKPGDDGLVIVVEPWDGSGKMLAEAADISVALIDPAEPKATARYAQWQFDAPEATKLFRDGDMPGLHLELPWPGDPPRHDRLHLFVRYTTSDGRKLETDAMVEIELGGRGRWVASDSPPIRPNEQPIVPAVPSAAPQLLAADSSATPAKTVSERPKTAVRTVSMAGQSTGPDARPATKASASRPVPQRNGSRTPSSLPAASPCPLPERERNRGEVDLDSLPTEIPYAETRPVPVPLPKTESPRRQRPVWSPDRPW